MKCFNPAPLGILAAVACALTSGVLAQEQPNAPPAAQHARRGSMDMHEHRQEKRAAQLKALHDALNIRPEQETAFSAFAAAMSPPPGVDGHHHKGDELAAQGALTTPQRLDLMAQRIDVRAARMKQSFDRRAAATKALYAALKPEQQHTMDALHGLMGHDVRHKGGHEDAREGGRGHGGWGAGQG